MSTLLCNCFTQVMGFSIGRLYPTSFLIPLYKGDGGKCQVQHPCRQVAKASVAVNEQQKHASTAYSQLLMEQNRGHLNSEFHIWEGDSSFSYQLGIGMEYTYQVFVESLPVFIISVQNISSWGIQYTCSIYVLCILLLCKLHVSNMKSRVVGIAQHRQSSNNIVNREQMLPCMCTFKSCQYLVLVKAQTNKNYLLPQSHQACLS